MALWTRFETLLFLVIICIWVAGYFFLDLHWLKVPWTPLALIGTAVAFVIGFQNNSSYGRIWEARQIWGSIVNSSRTFGMMVQDFINNDHTKNNIDENEIYNEKKIASHNFEYDNLQNNIAPIISNPLFYYVGSEASLMDTIQNGTINEFTLSIKVVDSNGLSDIDSVYVDLFNYQDSNNTTITPKILLYDDGNNIHGDNVAGDGIYSRNGSFPDDSEGNRKFDFVAIDRLGVKSNIVSHNFVVVK